MKQSIKSILCQAIFNNQWVDINYTNKKGEKTRYYIGINDIDIKNNLVHCEIFNAYKDCDCLRKPQPIALDRIDYAYIVENSFYLASPKLKEKIDKDDRYKEFFEIQFLDNNILNYLSDCYHMDNDPYIRDKVLLEGVDIKELLTARKYKLDDRQFVSLLNSVFKGNERDAERIYRSRDLAINRFSIDVNGKQYVVAYRHLTLNFKDRTLKVSDNVKINKSFLLDRELNKKISLYSYLDVNSDKFEQEFAEHPREYIEDIKANFRSGEMVDTSPNIFLLEREFNGGVDRTFEAINEMDKEGELTAPIKAFFGRNRLSPGSKKGVNVVIFDKDKINIDQMRVVYNSMVNHTTYIKGPPGTGKTETIFNVLLSAYANDKKVLVCSNNNHPVDDIFSKMTKSIKRKNFHTHELMDGIFPIMRLGSNVELQETINKLRVIYDFVLGKKNTNIKEESTEKSKNKSLAEFEKLREIIQLYEERLDLYETINKLSKLKEQTTSNEISQEIYKQREIQVEKYNEMPYIKDEDVAKYAVSANSDIDFQNYIYYSTLSRYMKLLNPTYKELVEIIKTPDTMAATTQLNKYLKHDKNLKRFTDIFPIIVTTNISADKLGTPKPHFDLCIMDEAGQCNIATSLIPIIRATDLLLVGDTNQLQPVTVIESDVNNALMDRYNIKKEYNYIHNSILSTMLSKDKNSKSILLRYHYRCGQKIAGFVNKRFYDEQLKLVNQLPGELVYVDVKNNKIPGNRNAYNEEAKEIAKIIKRNNYHDVGIVTPFVNQSILINDYLQKNGIKDVRAGTIHTLQGSERSVIIMSSALCPRTGKKTMNWVKNNHELINVAVTRAKDKLIFVGDREAIDTLSKDDDETSDIKALSDYVAANGEYVVPKSDVGIATDFSNNSTSEKEFFDTITPYFTKRGTKLRIDRNVPVADAIKNIHPDDLPLIGKKEFDVIVQSSYGLFNNRYQTIVVFEIDGGEHVGSKVTAMRDRQKEEVCRRYGIKLIRIANNEVKDYELIIKLFESIIKKIPDMQDKAIQMSLFEIEQ